MNRKLDQPEQRCTAETVPTSAATSCSLADLPVDQIICGDNCDVLGTFPRDCIDLVVTSPPYDDLRTYGGHDWDFYGVAWQLKRVLKPGGVVVWVVADQTKNGSETGTSFEQALYFRRLGLNLHDTMIYQRWGAPRLGIGQDVRYVNEFEFMFVLSAGKPATANILKRPCKQAGQRKKAWARDNHTDAKSRYEYVTSEETLRGNVWNMLAGGRSSVGESHPAVFPDELAEDHIRSWSNEGDIVLDPFNGSGTTCKAARELGRRFIGIDVNQEYCELARNRIAQKLLFA